jgi:hypothetical protein
VITLEIEQREKVIERLVEGRKASRVLGIQGCKDHFLSFLERTKVLG